MSRSKKSKLPFPPTEHTVFVSNLPYDFSSAELRHLVEKYCKPLFCRVPSWFRGIPKGCGFVSFPTRDDADRVIRKLKGTVVGKYEIEVELADLYKMERYFKDKDVKDAVNELIEEQEKKKSKRHSRKRSSRDYYSDDYSDYDDDRDRSRRHRDGYSENIPNAANYMQMMQQKMPILNPNDPAGNQQLIMQMLADPQQQQLFAMMQQQFLHHYATGMVPGMPPTIPPMMVPPGPMVGCLPQVPLPPAHPQAALAPPAPAPPQTPLQQNALQQNALQQNALQQNALQQNALQQQPLQQNLQHQHLANQLHHMMQPLPQQMQHQGKQDGADPHYLI
ncbi:hypothetical protein TRFO_32473 [Tritrichomonas foetus]|uniref:RRM domain-containing protein n=1 Tax=Tritrichomonas foetus TaxID=1144522 RepID=A0A1J4JT92_9EUKA|nr:hypothetical protein TRFO_32473 [Tritrichomonas foetus]|eukprot:OHT00742.1 hypothetical protein TRFO_32473 [Tritrichomonas foetus]